MRRHVALVFLLLGSLASTSAETNLIVPFYNISEAANLDWIGESISEIIREALVSHDVLVLPREERAEAAHSLSLHPGARLTKASLIKLGNQLDAARLIQGEFEWTPENNSSSPSQGLLRITAHVIDLKLCTRGPDVEETGEISNLARMQASLAWKILRFVRPEESCDEKKFFELHPPVRIDAMEDYIRGLQATALAHKHRFFTQAALLDREFSQPCFQLGRMQWEDNNYKRAAEWLERVTRADAHYVEANFLLGLCKYHMGDYTGAQAAFILVAKYAPLSEVYNNLGAVLLRLRLPEALDNLTYALKRNSEDADYHFNVGYILWRHGDLSAAEERFRAVLGIDPGDADARRMLERCLTLSGPRRGDLSSEGLERLKENYEDIAYHRMRLNAD